MMKYFLFLCLSLVVASNNLAFSSKKPKPAKKYKLTVTGGTGSGSYPEGASVSVVLGALTPREKFVEWVGSAAQHAADIHAAKTTVIMPGLDIELRAVIEQRPNPQLEVRGGFGTGTYPFGKKVAVSPDTEHVGEVFDFWKNSLNVSVSDRAFFEYSLNRDEQLSAQFRARAAGEQSPYFGYPHRVPGLIEAEHFDFGGEGIAYHDFDAKNWGNDIRAGAVDILLKDNGVTQLGFTSAGEWIKYSIFALNSGPYRVDVAMTSRFKGGSFKIFIDDVEIDELAVPHTKDWLSYGFASSKVFALSAGKHELRLEAAKVATENGHSGDVDFIELVLVP